MSLEVMNPRSGIVSGEVPCGVITESGLVNTFTVHEMTGVEEELLASKGPVVPRLNRVILNCSDQFGTITEKRDIAKVVEDLTAVDRMVLLIAIRRATLGDKYEVKITCPECDHSGHYAIDLAHLELKPMKEPMSRERSDTLSNGKVIEWHVMSGKDESWLQSQVKRLKNKDMLTLALLARVNKLGDDEMDRRNALKDAIKALKGLSLGERNEIRSLFREHEGTIDTKMEHECPSCSYEFSGELDVGQPSFFFPQGVSTL